jgi:hypothetical protein
MPVEGGRVTLPLPVILATEPVPVPGENERVKIAPDVMVAVTSEIEVAPNWSVTPNLMVVVPT